MSSFPGAGGRPGKRRRRRPPAHYHSSAGAEERLYLQQAIQKHSKLNTHNANGKDGKSSGLDLPAGPVFYPTKSDFEGNPLDYIERIRPIAEAYGVCKIVPPEGWNPAPFCIDRKSDKRFQTKLQVLHRLQEGISYGDGVEYSVEEYLQIASKRCLEWKNRHYPDHDLLSRHAQALSEKNDNEARDSKLFNPANLERDYWDIVESHTRQVSVEYGNDVDTAVFGSGFPVSERGRSVNGTTDPEKVKQPEPQFGTEDYYKETYWNLNNIPCAPDSVLQRVRVGINGINVPWMYYGSLFSTFAYHNEDNYLYSINYHHRGAPKQWYGVPGSKEAADGLEKVFKSYMSMKMREIPDLLHHITTMFSPRLLQNAKVPVYSLVQYEGEFVITFPRAFHGGFSYGPNAGEAVNFAPHDWITYGADANERYRSFARPAVFSHDRLTFTMAHHLQSQKKFSTCRLLLNELERVVAEELQLRKQLKSTGIRDVSHLIKLPANRLDQLDEKSATYDDKRLCHACKHVCFFSAVACECSQSKVSCLRHSHYMCRCSPDKKYFMIWSPNEELECTLARVKNHCETLEKERKEQATPPVVTPSQVQLGLQTDKVSSSAEAKKNASAGKYAAPGSKKDALWHQWDDICTTSDFWDNYQPCYSVRTERRDLERRIAVQLEKEVQSLGENTSEKGNNEKVEDLAVPAVAQSSASATADSEDPEIEIIEVRAATGPSI